MYITTTVRVAKEEEDLDLRLDVDHSEVGCKRTFGVLNLKGLKTVFSYQHDRDTTLVEVVSLDLARLGLFTEKELLTILDNL